MNIMRIAVVLPGLHRVNRGAETAFEAISEELAKLPSCQVTVFGSGDQNPERHYRFVKVGCRPRERFEQWPRIPIFRGETVWEEATFLPGLLKRYTPSDFDISVTCSYPFTNWFLRFRKSKQRPKHIYVTQNGDWPCHSRQSEYKWFGCDGLVCTNPEFLERNQDRWNCVLIPNGVDPTRFFPHETDRAAFDIPNDRPVVLMVSALIPSKRVIEGIEAVAQLPDFQLVVAGDGPLRAEVQKRAEDLLPGRFQLLSVPRQKMPLLYRCANVFLHMSMDEPSANAYIEALASGLPIVTHDRTVTRWTLEESAFLVDTTVPSAVARGIESAIVENRLLMVNMRRDLVDRRFTWSRIALQYVDFFQRVISE